MIIFPAIDLKGGNAVRLFQGDYNKVTTYDNDPLALAKKFKRAGAENLHIVDLDGAKDGNPVNCEIIEKIVKESDMFVQVGGGIRDEDRILRYLKSGASRVILGTIAVENFDFLCEMVKKYGDKIAVSVDVKNGCVAVSGWTEVTSVKGIDFCRKLAGAGVETIIYTDISKDGTLGGTNLTAYGILSEIRALKVIASGGITFEHEILQLKAKGIYGAILGKALYSGMLNLASVIQLGGGSYGNKEDNSVSRRQEWEGSERRKL